MKTSDLTIVISSCLVKSVRLEYLKQTIQAIRQIFKDSYLIVCFDKVGVPELDQVDLCLTHNEGLGKSFNLGIEKSPNELILQIEEDWLLMSDLNETTVTKFLDDVYQILKSNKSIVHVYGDPQSTPIGKYTSWPIGVQNIPTPLPHIQKNKPTMAMAKSEPWLMYYYSNWPHFKLKSFLKDLPYKENCGPPQVELTMCRNFLESSYVQKFYKHIFKHIGKISSQN